MGAYILRRLLLMIPTIVGIMAISFTIIQFAPGGPVEQVIAQLTGQADNAFCVVRPPGHHASANRGMGFCMFNNIAIGKQEMAEGIAYAGIEAGGDHYQIRVELLRRRFELVLKGLPDFDAPCAGR